MTQLEAIEERIKAALPHTPPSVVRIGEILRFDAPWLVERVKELKAALILKGLGDGAWVDAANAALAKLDHPPLR